MKTLVAVIIFLLASFAAIALITVNGEVTYQHPHVWINGIPQEESGGGEGEGEGAWAGCPEGELPFCTFSLSGSGGSGTGTFCMGFDGMGPPTGITVHIEHTVSNPTGAYVLTGGEGCALVQLGDPDSPITYAFSLAEMMMLLGGEGGPSVFITNAEYPAGAVVAISACTGGEGEGTVEGSEEGEILGACCNQGGGCFEYTEVACEAIGNIWLGPGTTCDPNPCGLEGEGEGAAEGEGEGTVEGEGETEGYGEGELACIQCPEGGIVEQPVVPYLEASNAIMSDANGVYSVYEKYSGCAKVLSLTWWGFDGDNDASDECTRNVGNEFLTSKWSVGLDGNPDESGGTWFKTATRTACGTISTGIGAGITLYKYTCTFAVDNAPDSVDGTGFLSTVGRNSAEGCFFYWRGGTGGDTEFKYAFEQQMEIGGYDLSMCVDGNAPEPQ